MRPMEFHAEFVLFILWVPVAALVGYALGYLIRRAEGKILGGLITGVILAILAVYLVLNPLREPQASDELILMIVIVAFIFVMSALFFMIRQNNRRKLVQPLLREQAISSGCTAVRVMNPNKQHRRP